MSRLANLLVVLVAATLLAWMLATNPDYNSAIRPIVTEVASGESGATRLIAGRFVDWRTADQLLFQSGMTEKQRTTQGVFLIMDVALSGTSVSTAIEATWIGASGRRYRTTRRIHGVARLVENRWLQPGLERTATAVFELPPDEVRGGTIELSRPFNPPLDGALRLAPPPTDPRHEAVARFEP